MENFKQILLNKLDENFKNFILSTTVFRNDLVIEIKKEKLLDICQYLRDDFELCFDMCKDVLGVDYSRQENSTKQLFTNIIFPWYAQVNRWWKIRSFWSYRN